VTPACRRLAAACKVQGCQFHRVESGFCCQGGDIVKGDGSSGDSIYGGRFNDEKAGLKLKHSEAGVCAMANSGKHSNTSQFFITLAAAPQCDGALVVRFRLSVIVDHLHYE
jgi:peptidylprolyl isomerase